MPCANHTLSLYAANEEGGGRQQKKTRKRRNKKRMKMKGWVEGRRGKKKIKKRKIAILGSLVTNCLMPLFWVGKVMPDLLLEMTFRIGKLGLAVHVLDILE